MVMLARSAEDLYWVGRYLERTESMARTIDVVYHRSLETPEGERGRVWADALTMIGFPDDSLETVGLDNDLMAAHCLVHAVDGSALESVGRLRENARGNREHLPIELWEEINRFWLEFRDDGQSVDAATVCSMVRRRCQSIVGTADATWLRTDPWTYFTIGRLVERALLTTILLRVRHHQHRLERPHEWAMTLRCSTALQAHRRQFTGFHDPRSIVHLLLYSDAAPRSVHFCVRYLRDAVDQLSSDGKTRSRRVIGRLQADLEFGDAFETDVDDFGATFDHVERQLRLFAASLAAEFFLLPLETGLQSLRLGAADSLEQPL